MRNSIHGQRPLAFRSFTFDAGGETLFTHDITGRRHPAYSIQKPRFPKHQFRVSRISGPNWNPTVGAVGGFRVHSLSSRIDVELQGHASQIKRGGIIWRTKHSFEFPPLGTLEWKQTSLGGEMHLIDEGGRMLARCASNNNYIGDRVGRIEIVVPGDDDFVDMCVVTSLAKWRTQEMVMQAVMSG